MSTKRTFFLIAIFFLSCSKSEKSTDLISKEVNKVEKKNEKLDSIRFSKRALNRIKKYEHHIKKYSVLYGIDWRLIVSIIMRESSFKPNAVSRVGAKGLMQIMPRNENYLESELDIDYIYERPEENIKAGIYHLKQQMDFFKEVTNKYDLMKVALASYNAGYGRLRDAINLSRYLTPKDPYNWINIKNALTKLKPRNYELHLEVWALGKPKYGYFRNPKETIDYVEKIMVLHNYFSNVFKS